jgi:hypothetical protein
MSERDGASEQTCSKDIAEGVEHLRGGPSALGFSSWLRCRPTSRESSGSLWLPRFDSRGSRDRGSCANREAPCLPQAFLSIYPLYPSLLVTSQSSIICPDCISPTCPAFHSQSAQKCSFQGHTPPPPCPSVPPRLHPPRWCPDPASPPLERRSARGGSARSAPRGRRAHVV